MYAFTARSPTQQQTQLTKDTTTSTAVAAAAFHGPINRFVAAASSFSQSAPSPNTIITIHAKAQTAKIAPSTTSTIRWITLKQRHEQHPASPPLQDIGP